MTADEWNRKYPVGICVRYYPIKGEPKNIVSKTRSKAWHLGSGHPVVKIEARTGGVLLDHLELIPDGLADGQGMEGSAC